MSRLSADERFEDAAIWRERLHQLATGSMRTHRLLTLTGTAQVVAAAATPDGGWDIHVIRYGRLAAAGHCEPGVDPRPAVAALVAAAEHTEAPFSPAPAGLTEEALELLKWLDAGDVRLVETDVPMSMPLNCGGAFERRLTEARQSGQRHRFGAEEYREVAEYARPLGPVDGRQVSRILSA
jgi:DNA polymerase-3 subunit epsilon